MPTIIPLEKKHRFLEELTRTGNITLACECAGVNRASAYHWRTDDKMKAAWDLALQVRTDVIREELVEKALVATGHIVDEYLRDEDGELVLDENFEPIVRRRLIDYDARIFTKLLDKVLPSADGTSQTNVQINTTVNAMARKPRLVNATVIEDAEYVAETTENV